MASEVFLFCWLSIMCEHIFKRFEIQIVLNCLNHFVLYCTPNGLMCHVTYAEGYHTVYVSNHKKAKLF